MFAQGMREKLSAEASDDALLQRRMPAARTTVVAMEKPAAVPAIGEWPSETPGTKRTLPATSTGSNAGGWRRERAWVITIGLIKNIFSVIAVIVRAAMWHLNGRGVRRCNDTAVTSAGARWNAFWSGNAVGGYAAAQGAVALELVPSGKPSCAVTVMRGGEERLAILSYLKIAA